MTGARAATRGAVLAVVLFVLAASANAATPTLGRARGRSQHGYGTAHPATIDGGGDPTSLIDHVHWSAWGARQAVGKGIADFVWPGQSVAGGSVLSPAKIIAFDLGSCHGVRAYRKMSVYFPEYGQSFEPHSSFEDICGNSYPHFIPPTQCGSVAIVSPEGFASEVSAQNMSCPEALGLVANSPAVTYLYTGGRFDYAGLYCGTEGYKPEFSSPPILFECARGRVSVRFELEL
jgi:hypothetical protein